MPKTMKHPGLMKQRRLTKKEAAIRLRASGMILDDIGAALSTPVGTIKGWLFPPHLRGGKR
jgi:hypothetical protein